MITPQEAKRFYSDDSKLTAEERTKLESIAADLEEINRNNPGKLDQYYVVRMIARHIRAMLDQPPAPLY